MGLIVRTAGLSRTKVEIKRDFDYLARLWDEIRERTLSSTAPALIYRDSDLIKRAIRDLYHREIDEVIVEGEEGYKAAKGFMKLLMPSHVRRVKLHSESTPSFQRYGVEDQLSAMYQPVVQLKSGGYLVINPTEALVSIDINSGRSTREHNIEQTAYNTNLEAAQEIARQLRLRDMAGLIVIDFIDMEQNSHVRKVEKAMKEALKNDRARIQVGRISSFGLMEMSRQRLRTGVLEASTKPCPHCEGTGLMRTAASAGLSALRMLEDEAARGRGERICLRAGQEAAVYVLNKKRAELAEIEQRYGVDDRSPDRREPRGRADERRELGPAPSRGAAGRGAARRGRGRVRRRGDRDRGRGRGRGHRSHARHAGRAGLEAEGERQGRRRRRRRRGGRGRNSREGGEPTEAGEAVAVEAAGPPEQPDAPSEQRELGGAARRRQASPHGAVAAAEPSAESAEAVVEPDSSPMVERPIDDEPPIAETAPAEEPQPLHRKRRRRSKARCSRGRGGCARASTGRGPAGRDRRRGATRSRSRARKRAVKKAAAADCRPRPARRSRARSVAALPTTTRPTTAADEPRRSGWWQRTFG